MKKTFLVCGLLLGLVAANAQGTHVEFGIKAGANIATLSSDNSANYKSLVGLYAGGLAHVHVSKYFAVQPEIEYSMQGAKINGSKVKYDYINIPVLLQFMAGQGFRVETGPQIGFLTSAKAESGNVSYDVKSSTNSTDFSWAVGLGYLSSSNLGVDVRYNLGISDITKPAGKTVNNVLQLGLFYHFR